MRRWPLASLACLVAIGGCVDNPYGRPAPYVDGSGFPEELRGTILPNTGFLDGQPASYYLLEPATREVAEVIVLVDDTGQRLAPCATGQRDEQGLPIDLADDECQGVLFSTLPGQVGYSSFVRILEAVASAHYALGSVRSREELQQAGMAPSSTDRVVDFVIVDAAASLAGPATQFARMAGWYEGLRLIHLELGGELPTDAFGVVPVDLFVPSSMAPGEGGDILTARTGDAGYSSLCRVVYFQVEDGYEAGDVANASDIPDEDLIYPDPEELRHCIAP